MRLSGPAVRTISHAILGTSIEPRHATFCDFRGVSGAVLDQGVALFFPAPHSYTGEDVLELQGHGSPVVIDMLVKRCLNLGARIARPGEFSERAFLSGQLDLAQAEAVADLIESSTEAAARSAVNALRGELSHRVEDLAQELIGLRIYVEAAIDFPEEEIDFLADAEVLDRLQTLENGFASLRGEMRRGRLLRDGLKVVLSGAPNVGKSSLLNLLLREQRAIVSDTPGTTRDVLEQYLDLDGLPVLLVDTAGIRESSDAVEVEGVRRARLAREDADLVLNVVDHSSPDNQGNADHPATVPVITVYNKIDRSGHAPVVAGDSVYLSARTGAGVDLLLERIKAVAGYREIEEGGFVARQRHIDALDRSHRHLQEGIDQLRIHRAGELLAEELRLSHLALGEITGEVSSDDLLGMIFSSFCIGK